MNISDSLGNDEAIEDDDEMLEDDDIDTEGHEGYRDVIDSIESRASIPPIREWRASTRMTSGPRRRVRPTGSTTLY